MPDFNLLSLRDGTPVRSESLRGRVVLVVFFTPWCSSCVSEMAMLEKLRQEYSQARFSVIGMAVVDKDTAGSLDQFVKKLALRYTILVSDDEVRQGFGGIIAVPTAFLIDKNGAIAQKFVSAMEKNVLSGAIDTLLEEDGKQQGR